MPGELGMVLSGGGAPAAYFGAGVAQAVADSGLRPTLFSGVSAGALNAAALSTGMHPDEVAALWLQTRSRMIYRPRLDVWNLVNVRSMIRHPSHILDTLLGGVSWTWFLTADPARKLVIDINGGETVPVADGNTLVVSAVDQGSADVLRFVNQLPPARRRASRVGQNSEFKEVVLTVDHVMASAAAPLLFPAGQVAELPDREFIDAGLVANTPLKPILAYEPDAVIVVSASGIRRPAPSPTSLGAAIGLLAENVAHFAMLNDYRHAQTVNTLVDVAPDSAAGKKHIELLLIEPHDIPFSAPGFLRFDPRVAAEVLALGRRAGNEALESWRPAERFRQ